MKSIFDAIRAAKTLRGSDEGFHLQEFERRNRGHQNDLDDLSLELMTRPMYQFTPSGPFRTRLFTVQDSLQALLRGLTDFVPAHAAEREDWQAILRAQDSSGLLLRTTLGLLKDWDMFGLYREFRGLNLSQYSAKVQGDQLRLLLTLSTGRKGALKASRELWVDAKDTQTIGGCLRLYSDARLAIEALLQTASSWEEFSPERAKSQYESELRERLRTTLKQNFSAEDLAWLRLNATTLTF